MNENQRYGGRKVPAEARIVGRNVRELRVAVGLTQKELAGILGISFQQVQKYERGENRFPLEKLYQLKQCLGIPYQVFFRGMGDDEAPKWVDDMSVILGRITNSNLQSKIERVVAIMME